MKNILLRKIILTGTLCTAIIIPTIAQGANAQSILSKDLEVSPIYYKVNHWSDNFLNELSQKYEVEAVFKDKDLNATITMEDFQQLIKLTLDTEYSNKPDALTREAIVHEMTKIWALKTENNLDEIMTIKMIIYPDTGEIDSNYSHSITVAYMKKIAMGKGTGLFDPKAETTYGELATLIYNTDIAIEQDSQPIINPIVRGKFETRATYEVKEDKVIFDFELMSHYTKPVTLTFGSGQSFELVITDALGKEVYRFADGKAFIQMIREQIINPGEELKFQDVWDMTNKEGVKLTSGKFKAQIKILAMSEETDEKDIQNEFSKVIEFSLD
ncbi:MAG: hypothetical protein K0R15_2661 [Clostridiales bacterium]|jgi:hypothetical protein|nr:hypothetical protein [Clostridiales bacterium]